MIPREIFVNVHGFDEQYFMYFEDADFCLRIKKEGYKTYYCPDYVLIHVRGGSWKDGITNMIKFEYRKSQILFYILHRSKIQTLLLRAYLILQYLIVYLFCRGAGRTFARSIITIALIRPAHRP